MAMYKNGILVYDITGNADTATALANSRTINGVAFDGTANIDITDITPTLTGDVTSTATAIDWDLKDNDSSALALDTGTVNVLNISTSDDLEQITLLRGMELRRWRGTITLATDSAVTDVGCTPNGLILNAGIRVDTLIEGLDETEHYIRLGVTGDSDKYVSVAAGESATHIDKNLKGTYAFTSGIGMGKETSALKLTITEGADCIPSAGKVEVEVVYLTTAELANT